MEKQRFTDFINRIKITQQLKNVEKQLKGLIGFQNRYVPKVLEDYHRLQCYEVDKALMAMPIDDLQKSKQGIRVSALKNAGYTNLYQLRNKSANQLESIRGVGQKSAYSIERTVASIAKDTYQNTKVRLDPYKRNNIADSLIKNVDLVKQGLETSESASKCYWDNHDKIQRLVKDSRPARHWLLWSLASEDAKQLAISSMSIIEEMAVGDYRSEVEAVYRRQQSLLRRNHNEIWKDFEKNPIGYYTTIERVQGKSRGGETGLKKAERQAVDNGLPIELATEISNVNLNLKGLKMKLRPYQEYGVKFILKQGSVLLGDDMGLGKTAQAIASMVCLYNSGKTHFLVVCPASVIVNWCREIKSWCPIRCFKSHGSEAVSTLIKWISVGGICVTTYETLDKLSLPDSFTYAMIVVDEAHYVKNPYANRTINVLHFRQRASRALYMTGTPLENRVDEMCFLVKCLNPGIAQRIDRDNARINPLQFRKDVAPVYFRRKKEDVLDELPEKIESEVWCDMTDKEKMLYRQYVAEGKFAKMRQVSWLISTPQTSSKASSLIDIVDSAISEGRKIIVFSFFLETIKQVKVMLEGKTTVYGPINGSVSPSRRQQIIDSFTKSTSGAVLLSQVQAGGTGLNIQAASVVVFCEPQLKPSIENQAVARAHRMGQLRSVLVYRLLCEKSVDERIMHMLQYKQKLFDEYANDSISGNESLIDMDTITKFIDEERERLNIHV